MGPGVIVLDKVLALGTAEFLVTLQRKRQIPITILGVPPPTTILGVLQRKRVVGTALRLIEHMDVARSLPKSLNA